MNYYEHHIRDYDAATAHLTWDQDLAYTRLIRWYYRKEQPLPADVKEVCRLVRATTKSQKLAVSSVLEEFFILQENGWHHEVCDAAIEKFLAGEPERVVKKANENNRLAKHRDERARLFKALTDAGESAHWNIKIDELRALVARVTGVPATAPATDEQASGNTPETQPATAPATPATATQTPIPNTQPPDTIHQTPSTRHHPPVNNKR
ncbi:MAG: YdaU family protein [Burkholderia cenocepacia]